MQEQYRYQEFGESKRIKPVLPWKFFGFSFIFTLIVFVAYLSLKSYYLPLLKKKIEKTSNEIHQLTQEINQKDRKEMSTFWSQMKNLEKLLANHYYPSNILLFLEKNTLPEVSLEKISFNYRKKSISIAGLSDKREAIPEQVKIFENLDGVTRVVLKSVSQKGEEKRGGEIISARSIFEMEIYFKPDSILYHYEK